MSIEKFLYKHQTILSYVALIVGGVMLIIGLMDVFLYDQMPGSVNDLTDSLGNWTYWFLVIGAFALIFSLWYVISRYRKIKEFNELMESMSKSKFRKNIARIETLALSLGGEYEERVIEKEKEYNIKR